MISFIILILSIGFSFGSFHNGFSITKHHNNKQLKEVLDKIHTQCPHITKVYHLSFEGKSDTVKGNKLYVIVFGKNAEDHTPGVPEFKYVGNMHGNEVVGREMLLRWAYELCQRYIAKDPYALKMIMNTRIHVMPTMNPDGWDIANGKTSSKREWLLGRANGNNVDLNRNFPDLDKVAYFNEDAGKPIDHLFEDEYWKNSKLELETKMVMKWILKNNFVLSANLHGGDVVANYPYDESNVPGRNDYTASPDDATFKKLALAYATHNPYMYGRKNPCNMDSGESLFPSGITNGADWYSVGGGMQDFNYLASNAFEITVEMGCTKFPPGERLPEYWANNTRALDNFALQIHTGIKGIVKGDGEPLPGAYIMVFNATDPEKAHYIEHNILAGSMGDYYRLLPSGKYVVMAAAEDFRPLLRCVKVSNNPGKRFSAKHLDFVLPRGVKKPPKKDASCRNFPGFQAVRALIEEKTQPKPKPRFEERELEEVPETRDGWFSE